MKQRHYFLLLLVFLLVKAATAQVLTTPDGKMIRIGAGEQSPLMSVPAEPVPSVTDLQITGAPVVGIEYTAGYTYSDPLGRGEDHTDIVWFRADDENGTNEVQIATGTNYTLQNSDVGKYVYVRFTPYADNGAGGTVGGEPEQVTPFLVRETYYENPYLGQGWDHMLINVVNISFDGGDATSGDEIAVFDGNICCAHYTITGPVTVGDNNSYLSLSASKVDMGNDGYTPGNAITIRYWRKSAPTRDYSASLEFFNNSGDLITAPVFTPSETTFVQVTITP